MPKRKSENINTSDFTGSHANANLLNPARIYAVHQETRCLDPTQLARLEDQFRSWSESSSRPDMRASRKRILLMFLLIRYTGARLNEVLALNPSRDIDASNGIVRFGKFHATESSTQREVQISSELMSEIQEILKDAAFADQPGSLLGVDAAHVRRKFYGRSVACGFAQDLGSPNAIRKARAVELMCSNMPLPVVQRILGHSTPNLTASLMSFSDEDIHQVARHFVERESRRKTSARNTFFGKIGKIRKGDIQSQVDLVTLAGDQVATVITNNSLERMGLKVGSLVAAEVKAPWVMLQKTQTKPLCTAENLFPGKVTRILRGKLTTEFVVRIQDGTELCSVVTEQSRRDLALSVEDDVWIMFNSFAVVLHVD
ncbi:MAG: TOBE domain-containing protein [Desulfomonile tiedjei]|uniref:TOBE domain-containing protein n=1 Tax=Desulfomonile tiedjei TaxID=2358 RepID=A0A9D6YYN5_9BACT|nr:TOBE domain-containing protein [Desulfomonile tiedjei]